MLEKGADGLTYANSVSDNAFSDGVADAYSVQAPLAVFGAGFATLYLIVKATQTPLALQSPAQSASVTRPPAGPPAPAVAAPVSDATAVKSDGVPGGGGAAGWGGLGGGMGLGGDGAGGDGCGAGGFGGGRDGLGGGGLAGAGVAAVQVSRQQATSASSATARQHSIPVAVGGWLSCRASDGVPRWTRPRLRPADGVAGSSPCAARAKERGSVTTRRASLMSATAPTLRGRPPSGGQAGGQARGAPGRLAVGESGGGAERHCWHRWQRRLLRCSFAAQAVRRALRPRCHAARRGHAERLRGSGGWGGGGGGTAVAGLQVVRVVHACSLSPRARGASPSPAAPRALVRHDGERQVAADMCARQKRGRESARTRKAAGVAEAQQPALRPRAARR